MKILPAILWAGFMVCPLLGIAQEIPLFQFTLHFEDNIGNQDSVIIGYDSGASSQDLNEQFGEIWLTAPFDSVFEVRVIHGDDGQNRTSKKSIEHMEMSLDSCILAFHTKIIINAKFPPVQISYDSILFPIGTCRNVILSPEWNIFFLPQWWDVCDYHCMAGASMYSTDLVVPPPATNCWNRLFIEKEVEGQGLKMLPGLFFATFFGHGPCNDTTFLAVEDGIDFGFGTLIPNPVREKFSIQVSSDDVQASINDMTGRLIICAFTVSSGVAQFDVSNLNPGMYFVSFKTGDGRKGVYKFLKV